MSRYKVSKSVRIVNLDFTENSFKARKKLARSVGSKAKSRAGILSAWRKAAKLCGGNYDNHARLWRFDAPLYVAKIDKRAPKNRQVKFSPVPFGMTPSLGKGGKLKLGFGATGMYELAKVSGLDLIATIGRDGEVEEGGEAGIQQLLEGVEDGRDIGCEYFKIRIGQNNAFWQLRAFRTDVEDEILKNLLKSLNGYKSEYLNFVDVYLMGFTSEEVVSQQTRRMLKVRKEQKFIRKRMRKEQKK